MEKVIKLKKCGNPVCENEFSPYYTTDKYCSGRCAYKCTKEAGKLKSASNKATIRKKSKKLSVLELKYTVLRAEFLGKPENKYCPVTCGKTTEVHHMLGRKGYADEWAREKDIPLIIDTRFFLAVSHVGHVRITEESEWALEMGYSLLRTVTRYGKSK